MTLRVAGAERREAFDILVDGAAIPAYPGETVAGALLAAGIGVLRATVETGRGRGQFCGMGVCYDCLVEIDGRASLRACMTAAAPGMRIAVPGRRGAA